jgi:hypothetical protein
VRRVHLVTANAPFTDTDPMRPFINKWGSTLIFASFVITAGTGVLLYFRVRAGSIEQLHIWIGFLMIAGALLHVARNWHQFLGYFKRPPFYAGLALTAVLCALLSYPVLVGTDTAGKGGRPDLRSAITVSRAVASASLAELAPLAKTDANGLMDKLAAMGVTVSDPTASLQSVATSAGRSAEELAAVILGGGAGGAAEGVAVRQD